MSCLLKKLLAVSILAGMMFPALASDSAKCAVSSAPWYGVLMVLLFAAVGSVVLFVCFKLFDLAITAIKIEKEIKNGNIAVAIFAGAIIIGIALIVAAAISG